MYCAPGKGAFVGKTQDWLVELNMVLLQSFVPQSQQLSLARLSGVSTLSVLASLLCAQIR